MESPRSALAHSLANPGVTGVLGLGASVVALTLVKPAGLLFATSAQTAKGTLDAAGIECKFYPAEVQTVLGGLL